MTNRWVVKDYGCVDGLLPRVDVLESVTAFFPYPGYV